MVLSCLILGAACSHPRSGDVEAIVKAYDEASTRVAWPGFNPAEIPLVLYDDAATYLLRHPAPPQPFEEMRGATDAWVVDTLLSALSANTDVEIGGVRSAAVGLSAGKWDAESTAALLLHEAFHAYQAVEHPDWTANEVDLFTYPFRSAVLLQLRRLEVGALRRAVTAPDSLRELCWAQAFLRARAERFDRLPAAASAYERATELREGLARYVQSLASGRDPEIPADGFRPEDVRERAYEVGHGLAVLLDRLAPGWRRELTTADEPPALESLLDDAIGGMSVRHCGPSPDETARARSVARTDSADLVRRDRRARAAFEDAPGWSIEIVADGQPLSADRFDPLSVRVLDDRHVLHERWIAVSNAAISAEALGRQALTRGLRGHPLFAGVDRWRVTGLREPTIEERGDTIRIAGEGVTILAVGARLERDGQRIRLFARRGTTGEGR